MSKNSVYTFDYFQPPEYHFSLDSVFLAQKVAKLIEHESNLESWKMLDLCAGCGIIGLELTLHLGGLHPMDFLEVQEVYQSYFERNVEMIYGSKALEDLRFLNMNYEQLLSTNFQNSYDLIVSNPPYFFEDEGIKSPSEFKNRCRFFIDSDFKTLIKAIVHSLKANRKAYLLVRSGKPHGRDPLNDIQNLLGGNAQAMLIDKIRGTDIIAIAKKMPKITFNS